ncbi:MAG: hypothetical protein JEZ03_04305 [Bacteroidales bacterium]|nr:hypothetical protein [Bacteroidales bacterium]
MKRSNLEKVLLLLVLGLFVMGCSKEETPEEEVVEIIGVWNCSSVDYTGTSVTEVFGQSISSDFVGKGYNVDFTFSLSEDPNVATTTGSYDIKLTTTTLGQSYVQNIEDIAFVYVGSWSQAGDKLTINREGETSVATITAMTDSLLELNFVEERTMNNGGANVTITTDTDMIFTR